jgi:hypothetical protein
MQNEIVMEHLDTALDTVDACIQGLEISSQYKRELAGYVYKMYARAEAIVEEESLEPA